MTTQEATVLEAETRTALGKNVRFLRRQGLTPANLYGRGMSSVSFQVPTRTLERLVQQEGRSGLVTLSIDGTSHRVLLRDLQRHPLTHAIVHAEFYRVEMDRPVQVAVPIHLVGEAPAAKLPNALISQVLYEITVECLPGDIPHVIEVDISGLTELDTAILVQDVKAPAGVTLLADPELMVVHATESQMAAAAAEPEAGAAAPEPDAVTATREREKEEG
jgi:large subunit ribosomal protein L25